MKEILLLVYLLLFSTSIAFGAEVLTLATPVTKPSVAKWQLMQLNIIGFPTKSVSVTFYDPDHPGDPTYQATCVWDATTNPTASSIISTLNTANLTSNSLQKRATTAAQSLGCIGAGTVAGTPE